ncbi:hypothetical protein Daus18300_008037 [Diaporthe australafricana]|uniref:Uncharacterized protein n=1 Tax=Diaporthe australafricana TaxID=127596 RepID=A0ABR3WK66_9PEZI
MADDVSTASEPDMTAPRQDTTSPDDLNVSAASAAVTWDGHTQPLTDVTCDIRRYASSNTAFVKLRATVALKPPAPAKTSIFLFIHPERIRTMALDESSEPTSQETAKKKLGQNTYCLRFTLDRPADLVGPASPENITPKNKNSAEMLHHLRSLARETNFALHLPAKVASKTRLLSFCEAASGHDLTSVTWQADMTCLYGGKGGRVIGDAPAAPEDPSAEPPSYDELEPGPPLPPLSGPCKKRRRDSDGSGVPSTDLSAMEAMCRKVMGEMKAELKLDMSKQLQKLETSIMERLEQRLAEESARVEERVDQQLLEVREETTDEIGTRIEDEYYGVRVRLEDFVKDEVQDAEERIVHHIESSATVSLQFNT